MRKIASFKKVLALVLALSMFFGVMLSACNEVPPGSHEEINPIDVDEGKADRTEDPPPINIGPGTSDLPPERLAAAYNPENYKNKFQPGEVIVGINRGVAVPGNPADLFPELDFVEIDDLFKSPSMRTVYKIKLSQRSRESVIEAIEILKQNPNVSYAEPNYINSPALNP